MLVDMSTITENTFSPGTSISPVRRRPVARWHTVLGAVGLSVLLVACGSDDVVTGPVEITATDYAYGNVPERVAAGSSITLSNESAVEVHELVAIRLPDDESRPVDELVALGPEELAAFFPLVEAVIVAPPEAEGVVVEGDATLDQPGRYALICVIPTGADPEEYLQAAAAADGAPPEVDGGAPHIAAGMYAELLVE